jgi:hypothetical protein
MVVVAEQIKAKKEQQTKLEDRLFDSVDPIQQLAEADVFERVGSMIWWEIKRGFDLSYDEAQEVFKSTPLARFIESIPLCYAIDRFSEKVLKMHKGNYRNLQFFKERLEGYWYCVFYTGKLRDKDTSSFTEHARFVIGEEGEYFCLTSQDSDFLYQETSQVEELFKKSFNIIHVDIQSALSMFSNSVGYRFNDHGGCYFIPFVYTDELYRMKSIVGRFGQKLAITPLIGGCDEDVEEIVNIIGDGFKEELQLGKRQIFEICLQQYGMVDLWNKYRDAVKDRDMYKIKNSPIANSRYGKELNAKLEVIDQNANDDEWLLIVKTWVDAVKPAKNPRVAKVFQIRDNLRASIEKMQVALQTGNDSGLLNKWYNKMLKEVYDINHTITALAKKMNEELESLI